MSLRSGSNSSSEGRRGDVTVIILSAMRLSLIEII
jgi:hypothetical protein